MRPLATLVVVLSTVAASLLTVPQRAEAATAPEVTEHLVDEFVDAGIRALGVDEAPRVSAPVEAPGTFTLVGFDLPDGEPLRVRTSLDGQDWSEWLTAEVLDEGPDGPVAEGPGGTLASSPVWVGPARWLQIEAVDLDGVRAHLIDGDEGDDVSAAAAAQDGVVTAQATQPPIVSRAQWGADESITRSSGAASTVQHAVIHHTATANDYSRTQAAAVVRSIHRYHTASQGWSDIGYNFLIDRYGTIYEGRRGGITRGVIGAHARGFNTGSVGVALIGNFDAGQPSSAAFASLRALLTWKLGLHGVDPTATVSITSGGSPKFPSGRVVQLPAINGHRDTGSTSCPGRSLYPELPALRAAVKKAIGSSKPAPPPDLARQCLPEGDPGIGALWRVGGADRIATAIAASRWYWRSSESAVLASASDFPDALSSGALAAREDAPLLLTTGDRLHSDVAGRLKEMGAKRVVLLGGPAALSDRVDSDVRRLGMSVTRVAGSNRFATAAQAALRAGAPSREAVVALGSHRIASRAWPDSVAAGALAATPQRMPTLLTMGERLPAETTDAIRRLGIRTVWIVGGTGSVSTAVEEQLASVDGVTVRRLAGATRYGTSVAVAVEARRRFSTGTTPLVLASGAAYPDGLAAAAVAARRNATLLLVPSCGLEQAPEILQHMRSTADKYGDGVLLGGIAASSERIRWQMGSHLPK